MATIQIRVDDALKADADALFTGLGMDTPTAIRVFLTQSLQYHGIPFELRMDPRRGYIRAALEEANEDARAGVPTLTEEEFKAKREALRRELSA